MQEGEVRGAKERETSVFQETRSLSPVRPAGPTPVQTPSPPAAVVPAQPRLLSWKGVLLGALLIWPNAMWVQEMEIIRGSAHPTTVSLYFNAIFILLVVTLANHGLAAVRPR